MAEIIQNKKQPGVIFLKGKAYYNKGTIIEGGGGEGKTSSLTVIEDIYEHSDVLYFENDSRFEITSNERPFSVQDKFQYDEHNMYSPSATSDNQSSYTRIKNISDKPIYLKVHYIVSSESSCDWLSILIRDIPEQDDSNYMINVSGEASGDVEVISIPAGYIMEMRYKKDGGAARGQDSGGFLFYELGKEEG